MNNRELADELERRLDSKDYTDRLRAWFVADNRDAILTALRVAPEGWRPSDEQVERAAAEIARVDCADPLEDHFATCQLCVCRARALAILRAASEPPP